MKLTREQSPKLTTKKQGRKPASESRATELREKLLAWRQTPGPQRISLRALAVEIGSSHQLLSFHLQRLDEWQIRRRLEGQGTAYDKFRAALYLVIARFWREAKRRGLTQGEVKLLKRLADRGDQQAQQILATCINKKNAKDNLPLLTPHAAKSFRSPQE